MNAVEIEEAISELIEQGFDADEFPFSFLEAYGNKPPTIKRLRTGNTNKSDINDAVLQTNNIHLLVCDKGSVVNSLDLLRSSPRTEKNKAKFILATDGREIQAENITTGETLACDYDDLPAHFLFFAALAGISFTKSIDNPELDVRATGRLNRLYVELLKHNPDWSTAERRHDMNQFMARMIFCFFAEDTDIFHGDDLFTSTIEQMSDNQSTNTHEVIAELFRAMDTKAGDRATGNFRPWANAFPYVNGGLFAGTRDVPKFSRIARTYLIHAGKLDWQKINPDIFGSMIQAVTDEEERGSLGMHYTSVENILKLLNPLFLDDLKEKLEEAGDNDRKLLNLRKRISKIRVFDPACGSGNFLVIAYKQMRKIEFEINKKRNETHLKSEIPLTNFRGIELRDFPAEIARLALIIAEFQCDVDYRGQKDALVEFLPLNAMNWITCGNSLLLDWLTVCPTKGAIANLASESLLEMPTSQPEVSFDNEGGETYICGNPPFAGQKKKNNEQRQDMDQIMPRFLKRFGELDYVTAFYLKAAEYCNLTGAAAALVSTNSIVQGRHIPLLWPAIYDQGCEIIFGYRSFLWSNNAKNNASVFCVIVGLSSSWTRKKYIYDHVSRKEVKNISAYLTEGQTTIVQKSKTPISKDLQPMKSGNMPLDNGCLILEANDAKSLTEKHPEALKFIKKLVGAKEINQGLQRHCLWIENSEVSFAEKIPAIKDRIAQCATFRLNSSAPKLAETPWAFRDRHREKDTAIILPNLSSEKRNYRIPTISKNRSTVASNLALAIYDGHLYQVAILASRIHHLWVEAVCGKLKQDFRYSNDLGWHTFPLPSLTDKQKSDLTTCAKNILLAQEAHFPACLNELYNNSDTNPMPENLKIAHERNDEVLERIYIGRRFKNDTERLEKLFDLYSIMINKTEVG